MEGKNVEIKTKRCKSRRNTPEVHRRLLSYGEIKVILIEELIHDKVDIKRRFRIVEGFNEMPLYTWK